MEYNHRGKNDEELSQGGDDGEEIEVLIAEIPKIFEPKENNVKLNPSKKLLCGRRIFHTGLRNDFTIRNKYSPVNRSRAFSREAG